MVTSPSAIAFCSGLIRLQKSKVKLKLVVLSHRSFQRKVICFDYRKKNEPRLKLKGPGLKFMLSLNMAKAQPPLR